MKTAKEPPAVSVTLDRQFLDRVAQMDEDTAMLDLQGLDLPALPVGLPSVAFNMQFLFASACGLRSLGSELHMLRNLQALWLDENRGLEFHHPLPARSYRSAGRLPRALTNSAATNRSFRTHVVFFPPFYVLRPSLAHPPRRVRKSTHLCMAIASS